MTNTEQVPVGKCPEHGVVQGPEVDFRFPQSAECNKCGSELERCTVASKAEIAAVRGQP